MRSTTTGPTGSRYPADETVTTRRHRRVRAARADRARGGAGRRARARPPRAVLGLPPDRADARRWPSALRPLFKHDINLAAYHLPLDAHPEVGNNALLAGALGLRARTSRSATMRHAGRRAGHVRGRRDRRSPSCSRACDEVTAARAARVRRRARAGRARSGSSPARRPSSLPEAVARGPRRVPDRRAARARDGRRARGAASTSSRPATTRPRRSACARWASCSRSDFGIDHVFVDIPNPV